MRSLSFSVLLGLGLSVAACGDKSGDEDDDDITDDTGGGGGNLIDADGDGSPPGEDCDDNDGSSYPGAPEICDGADNDCDGLTDGADDDLTGGNTYYYDGDSDGYGKRGVSVQDCSLPDGYADNDGDCLDTNANVNPSADELCNDNIDNDCDLKVDDEDEAVDAKTWYLDSDRDGHGIPDETTLACVIPEGYADNTDDCDDSEPSIYPGAKEYCDYLDNDCDDLIDGDDPDITNLRTWYRDADSDGYGVPGTTAKACTAPSGYVSNDDDCNDSDDTVSPGEPEICDDKDNDCDNLTDEADSSLTDALDWYADDDSDGYGDPDDVVAACEQPSGYLADSSDCDDTSSAVNPSAEEVCNGIDMDCDGYTYCLPSLGDAGLFLVGEASSDRAGYALSGAGDVDGDGVPDLLTSGYQNDDGGSNAGAAYLILGPASGTLALSSADATLNGEAASDAAGFSVAGVGDFDKDGYDDLLIGAYQNDDGASNAGAAYLVLGPVSGTLSLAAADADYTGEKSDDRAGFSVAAAGDVDGDGYRDLLIGAYQNDDGASNAGAAYLIFGGAAGDLSLGKADADFTGEGADDLAGRAVAGVGDTDADGYNDVAIAAPEEDSGGTDAGAVYLILGGSAVSGGSLSGADAMLTGEDADNYAGTAVAGAGDVNDDGYDDILIGAEGYDLDSKTTSAGAAYIVFGPITSGSLSDADVILLGENTDDKAGSAVAGGADVNADGYSDVLIGAYGDDIGGSAAGAAYLLYGPLSGSASLSSAVTKFLGENAFDYAGSAVALPGDINSDGYDDVFIGAYQEDSGGSSAGAAYLMTSW